MPRDIQFQVLRGVLANRPTLGPAEFYWATDTSQLFIGNPPVLVNSGGASADIALSLCAPSVNETISAGSSAVINRKYTVVSGKKLTIGLGAALRLL